MSALDIPWNGGGAPGFFCSILDASSKQKKLQDLSELARLAKREDGLEVSFRRNVPDETKPNSKLTRVSRALAYGLGTTLAAAATIIALPATPFLGIVEGAREYKDSAFMPKPTEVTGRLTAKDEHLYFLADNCKAPVDITQFSFTSDGGNGD